MARFTRFRSSPAELYSEGVRLYWPPYSLMLILSGSLLLLNNKNKYAY